MYTRHDISVEEHLAWWGKIRERKDAAYFMYECDGNVLGVVCFTQIDFLNNNSSWGFYASPNAPRGSGSRMEMLALDHAFGTMGLHKLYCEVFNFNKSVISLHQKFGFKVEGIFREHHYYDGEYVDIVRLGILSSEWERCRPEMLKRLKL